MFKAMIFECIHDSEETARVWLTDLCFKLFLDKKKTIKIGA